MIDSLLARITALWSKDFLFASFLPVLIFAPCLALACASVLGFTEVWAWLESLTAYQRTSYLALAALSLVVLAYVLSALRARLRWMWSGCPDSGPGLLRLYFSVLRGQQREYRNLVDRANRSSPWRDVLSQFESDVRAVYDVAHPAIGDQESARLRKSIHGLSRDMGKDRIQAALKPIVAAYRQFSGESLKDFFFLVKTTLKEWHDLTIAQIQCDTFERDRRFADRPLPLVRATRLGNIIESYDQYCYKRYQIEPKIFWPRLRGAVPEQNKFLEYVDDPAILLDFSLAMASLSVLFGVLALFVGPWLWNRPLQWGVLTLIAVLVAWFFYGVAVNAATQSGELIRATFDLFRLHLMEALERPRPLNLQAERAQWAELSSLATYGDVKSDATFLLRKKKEDNP